MRSILLFVTLMSFWLLLSGQFTPLLIGAGLLASAVAVFLCQRLDLIGSQYQPVESLGGFLLYLPWLLVQIVLASLDVTWKSWSFRPSIAPRLVEVPCQLKHPLAKTLLANSITLTPGTVTVDVGDDSLLVHALSDRSATSVLDGSMQRRIAQMVPDDSSAKMPESAP